MTFILSLKPLICKLTHLGWDSCSPQKPVGWLGVKSSPGKKQHHIVYELKIKQNLNPNRIEPLNWIYSSFMTSFPLKTFTELTICDPQSLWNFFRPTYTFLQVFEEFIQLPTCVWGIFFQTKKGRVFTVRYDWNIFSFLNPFYLFFYVRPNILKS